MAVCSLCCGYLGSRSNGIKAFLSAGIIEVGTRCSTDTDPPTTSPPISIGSPPPKIRISPFMSRKACRVGVLQSAQLIRSSCGAHLPPYKLSFGCYRLYVVLIHQHVPSREGRRIDPQWKRLLDIHLFTGIDGRLDCLIGETKWQLGFFR